MSGGQREQTTQGPGSHTAEFGFAPESCRQQGTIPAESVVQTDLCFERQCCAGAGPDVSEKEGGLDQKTEHRGCLSKWHRRAGGRQAQVRTSCVIGPRLLPPGASGFWAGLAVRAPTVRRALFPTRRYSGEQSRPEPSLVELPLSRRERGRRQTAALPGMRDALGDDEVCGGKHSGLLWGKSIILGVEGVSLPAESEAAGKGMSPVMRKQGTPDTLVHPSPPGKVLQRVAACAPR